MKKQKVWSSGRLVMKKAENIIVKFQLKVIRERNSNQHLINRCTGTELWLLADTNRRSPATDWQTKCCCAKRNPLRIRNGTHKLRLVTWTHDLQVPWLTLALLSATYWERSLELFTITTMLRKGRGRYLGVKYTSQQDRIIIIRAVAAVNPGLIWSLIKRQRIAISHKK